MRKILLGILLTVMLGGVSVTAQSYRVADLANRLSTQGEDLADRAYNFYASRANNSRTDLDNMMLAQQLSASANAFRRMVQDRRRSAELQDAAFLLTDLARRFPSYGDAGLNWRDAQRTIDDLSRELRGGGNGDSGNSGGDGNQGNPPENRDIIGQVRWRGTVDDEVQLYLDNNTLETRTISGAKFPDGNYNFTSPLPNNRRLTVGVNKLKGRGNVRILQQPGRANNFTAVVQIKDTGNGAKEYDLEIYWTR